MADLTDYLDKLPVVRKEVDAGTVRASAVFTFYNDLLDSATRLFNTQARIVPDVTATQGGIAATDLPPSPVRGTGRVVRVGLWPYRGGAIERPADDVRIRGSRTT